MENTYGLYDQITTHIQKWYPDYYTNAEEIQSTNQSRTSIQINIESRSAIQIIMATDPN